MAREQYNSYTGRYDEPINGNGRDVGGNRTGGGYGGGNQLSQTTGGNSPDSPDNDNDVDSTRNSDYLRALLSNMQSTGYRGGGGYNPKQLTFGGFSDKYDKYRGDQQGRVERYMDDPRGYNDQQFAMMSGRGADAITAQGGGMRQMMNDAISKGGIQSGSVYGGLADNANNVLSTTANMQRDLAINDMNTRTQQQQASIGAGSQWAGQMSSDDRWLTEGQMSVDSQNEANRARAAASARSGRTAYDNKILAMQMKIGESDVEEGRYDDSQAWKWKGYANDNRAVTKPTDYTNPYN